jgi:hypothetical protein
VYFGDNGAGLITIFSECTASTVFNLERRRR